MDTDLFVLETMLISSTWTWGKKERRMSQSALSDAEDGVQEHGPLSPLM
jgi:hypothetical protein